MSSPINLSGLPVAGPTSPSDLMLIRQGLTDYQIALQLVQSINVAAFDNLNPNYANSTDLMMIYRNGGNYQIQFSQVGFLLGTCMWFYNSAVPIGWTAIPNTGDRLLAVSDSVTKYAGSANPGTQAGSWQQSNATLTIDQIPAHSHYAAMDNSVGSSGFLYAAGKTTHVIGDQFRNTQGFPTGGIGSTAYSSSSPPDYFTYPGTNPHNHGNTWRPLANVGILGQKTS
jgi:hypothetical protein